MFTSVMPFLPVSDLRRSVDFYTDVLGFAVEVRGDVGFAIVARDEVRIGLRESSSNAGHGRCYCNLSRGISTLYDELCSRAVRIQHEMQDEPYGMREFTIVDPDQNQLHFGQPLP